MPSKATTEKIRLANSRKESARKALALFLSAFAAIIANPYWFTIRGDCELGLCLTSMLTIEEYAALLIVGQFVRVKKDSKSTSGFNVHSLSAWNQFLTENKMHNSIAEATVSRVNADVFKHRKARTKIGENMVSLDLLRIGAYEEVGETRKASLQLTDGIDPPPTSAKLRSIQRALHRRIKHVIHPILHSKEDEVRQQLEAVVKWVKMKELEEDVDDYARPANNKKATSTRGARVSTDEGGEPMDFDTHKDALAKNTSSDNTPPSNKTRDTTATFDTTLPPPPVMPSHVATTPFKLPPEPQPKQKVAPHLAITINCPTPKTKCYPDTHPNAKKYPIMNACGINLMDRTDGIEGVSSKQNFQGLLREMKKFALDNNEELEYESYTGKLKYKVVHIPMAMDEDDYAKKAKEYNWIQETLDWSLREGTAADSIACMLQYFKYHYPTEFKEKLIDLGVSPKQMNEYEMAATMAEAKIGIASWRKIVQCFTTFTRMDRV